MLNTRQLIRARAFCTAMSLIISSVFAAANPTTGVYKAPLNSYGQPDLEGTWTNATLTVLERLKEFAGPALVMTPEEVKKASKAMMQNCMPPMPRPGTPN